MEKGEETAEIIDRGTFGNNISWTFYYFTSLINVTIADSVTCIDDFAFYECTNLTSVIIGDGVTTIGINAFDTCESLTDITVDENNTVYTSLDGVLFNKHIDSEQCNHHRH